MSVKLIQKSKPRFFYPIPTLLDGILSTFDLSGKYFELRTNKNPVDMSAFHSDIISLRNDAHTAYTSTIANYV